MDLAPRGGNALHALLARSGSPSGRSTSSRSGSPYGPSFPPSGVTLTLPRGRLSPTKRLS